MCVHVGELVTQIAVLEGRSLIEHHVAKAQDDVNQIDGNILPGRVKNVLPAWRRRSSTSAREERRALLGRRAVRPRRRDRARSRGDRIEHLLRPGQSIVCQVTRTRSG